MPTENVNKFLECFEEDKYKCRFRVFIIDKEYYKYKICNHKVYFLIGYLLEYQRLHSFEVARDFRFQVYDYDYDIVYYDVWAPAEFRNVFWDVMLFNLGPSSEAQLNLWVLYNDSSKNRENVVE